MTFTPIIDAAADMLLTLRAMSLLIDMPRHAHAIMIHYFTPYASYAAAAVSPCRHL